MRNFLLFVFIFIISGYQNSAYSQQSSTNNTGFVKGVIRDTVHNYYLKSATVSLFKSDSTLISYQFSNNYGEFSFRSLAPNTKMYLEVSHVGYQLLRKSFITDERGALDLKVLVMMTKDITLKEVEIKIAPISMNGDTLEFNPSAFKLDSNAVVEDLLRKIPNVTLWGDGKITVNGREVKSLMVNGKSFFGGDFKIATQNIPKNALEKVQVYNTIQDRTKPLDSALEINLKLKNGKELGYFGKLGGGIGTKNRYEADINMNVFSPKMQFAIIGANNNINKIANSIQALTLNSTFKGVGTNVDYQPDFRQTGINKSFTRGFNFTYNFIDNPDNSNKKSLTTNYFAQKKNYENLLESQTVTTINITDKVFGVYENRANSNFETQNFDATYEFAKKAHRFTVKPALSVKNDESTNTILQSAYDSFNNLTSTNKISSISSDDSKKLHLTSKYDYKPQSKFGKFQRFGGFNIEYAVDFAENNTNRNNVTSFRSILDPIQSRDLNRRYDTQSQSFGQRVNLEFPDLEPLIFGRGKLWDLYMNFVNTFNITNTKIDNFVEDLSLATGTYIPNINLANSIQTNLIDESIGLLIVKGLHKSLSSRFDKNLTFSLLAKQCFVKQNNISDRHYQNIGKAYNNFVPAMAINYSENQFGEFYRNISVSFETNFTIPTIDQLAPIVDDANIYFIQNGNIKLRQEISRTINLILSHATQKKTNNFSANLNFSYAFIQDNIVDSLFVDKQNKRVNYLVNASGSKIFIANGSIRKAYKFKTSELQLAISEDASKNVIPSYLNNIFLYSSSITSRTKLNINFTYKDRWAIDASPSFDYYQSKQKAFNTEYHGKTLAIAVSTNYNVTKKIGFNSNITFNNNKASNSDYLNFNIWNASAIFRFLKGNNVEFKLSALDILRQNNNVLNSTSFNSFTTSTQMVLKQYFMTTLSYYPRQFGRRTASK